MKNLSELPSELFDELVTQTAINRSVGVNNQGTEAQLKYLKDDGLTESQILQRFITYNSDKVSL